MSLQLVPIAIVVCIACMDVQVVDVCQCIVFVNMCMHIVRLTMFFCQQWLVCSCHSFHLLSLNFHGDNGWILCESWVWQRSCEPTRGICFHPRRTVICVRRPQSPECHARRMHSHMWQWGDCSQLGSLLSLSVSHSAITGSEQCAVHWVWAFQICLTKHIQRQKRQKNPVRDGGRHHFLHLAPFIQTLCWEHASVGNYVSVTHPRCSVIGQ